MVESTPATVLLESSKPGATDPWTRLFIAPQHQLFTPTPAQIPALFAEIERAVSAGLFVAGYFTYEAGALFEPMAGLHALPGNQPLVWLGVYARCYRFDHRSGAFIDGEPPGLDRFSAPGSQPAVPLQTAFTLAETEFAERMDTIHDWIRAGQVYQLNFTAPLAVSAACSPGALYARLRLCQPVDFGAFLHVQPRRHILSFSPELFFRLDAASRRITTRPMKGTAPRGRNSAEDRAQAAWLASDPKNRAENLMIVDLLRNDLGRLCRFGSIHADPLFALERFSSLWQMTSTVRGQLRPEVGFQQIFRALFPCGSITGAPKVRAMQLLSQIESAPRGVYTGSIGFFSPEQTVFSVAIRTIDLDPPQESSHQGRVVAPLRGSMGVGGGIVADSSSSSEFRECLLKASFLTHPTEAFSLVETLLWRGNYPLLELHLDRILDSAAYFDFPCDRTEIQAALQAHATAFTGFQSHKIRLLLHPDGALHIESQLLPAAAPHLARVCLASQRTDARDRLYFHKTTHRPLYATVFAAATQAGFDDALFLNQRAQLTEGAISNLFIEKNGRWITPPVACGLLAGVFRRHLLETRQNIEERVLTLEDLRQADAIYLANAVRGLRQATIDWNFSL
jgi:para-aminobenzoate synthetase/4-amino-4-deoxychorismate lyase